MTVSENGCSVVEDFVLNSSPEIIVTVDDTTAPSCGEDNGSISISVSGGTPGYTYAWSGGDNPTDEDVTGLGVGTYTLTVTDAAGCSVIETIPLNGGSALSATAAVTNIVCAGDDNGSIEVTTTGGLDPLEYSLNGVDYQPGELFENLSAGLYIVYVRDAAGCEFLLENIEITEPADGLMVTATVTDASSPVAEDGVLEAMASGGSAPYSYQWETGQITPTIDELLPGDYNLTVTDDSGCSVIETFTVGVSSAGVLTVDLTVTDQTCFNANDGMASIVIDGGTLPYTITWFLPGGNIVTDVTELTDLGPGAYLVSVSDASQQVVNETFNITQPTQLSGGVTATGGCDGAGDGQLVFNVNGGTLPITISYEFDGTPVSVVDNDPMLDTLGGLDAGIYTNILITDDNGCTLSLPDATIESDALLLTETIEDVTCNGGTDGSVSVVVTGDPNGGYTYIWTDESGAQVGTTATISSIEAGDYFLNVTGSAGCSLLDTFAVEQPDTIGLEGLLVEDASCNGEATGSITLSGFSGGNGGFSFEWNDGFADVATRTDLAAGTYTVTATDQEGCSRSFEIEVGEPTELMGLATAIDASCAGDENGSLIGQATGGTPLPGDEYLFEWSTGATTQVVNDLPTGEYFLTVTDANGCMVLDTATIGSPDTLLLDFNITDVSCSNAQDGSIDLTTTGGTSDIIYEWSNGESTQDLNNLSGGGYTVTISYNFDGSVYQCQTSETVVVEEPLPIENNVTVDQLACNEDGDASLSADPVGGSNDFTFLWSTGATDAEITGLSAGIYTLTVTDTNGCTGITSDTIVAPDALLLTATLQRANCTTPDDGFIQLNISGGTAPYDIDWSTGASTALLSNLTTGDYDVVVTDANGCSVDDSFFLDEAPEPFTALFLAASGLFGVDTVQVGSDDVIQFKDVSHPNPTEWFWSFGDPDNTTSTEADPQFSYPFEAGMDETSYTAQLVVSNQFCTDSISKTIFITNNFRLAEPELDSIIYLAITKMWAYPNPTTDFVDVEIDLSREEPIQLDVYDAAGARMEHRTDEGSDRYVHRFDFSRHRAGTYHIRVLAGTRMRTLTVVVVR